MKKWPPLLITLSLLSIFLGVYVGSVHISVAEVSESIVYGIKSALSGLFPPISPGEQPKYFTIIWKLRLPRVLLAYLVGTALASAGVASQALFKNPLADPYIIGISAGAGIGGALGAIYWPEHMGPLAFICSLISVFIVYNVAKVNGKIPVDTLLLAGIAYGFLANAVTWYLIISHEDRAHVTWMWLMGTFNGRGWDDVAVMFIVTLLGLLFLILKWRELNLLLLGEESIALGLDLHLYRKLVIGTIALLTAFSVATAGIIGFIGLVSPHIMRLTLGPNHRELTPATALFGGTLLVIADLLARTVASPRELPVGIITAIMGAPLFMYLLLKHKRGELLA